MQLVSLVKTALKAARSFVAPHFCAYCRSFLDEDQVLCDRCLARLQPIVSMPFRITKKRELTVFAISDYEYPLRALVQAKQYGNRYAGRQLGRLVWEHTPLSQISFDIIVPIPLHWTRYAWRGFNQAQEMAQVISQKSGKPVVHLLERSKNTMLQAGLSRLERANNVQEGFCLGGDAYRYQGLSILFVDDVMTTGSTLFAASKAVALVRPKTLFASVACRVINR